MEIGILFDLLKSIPSVLSRIYEWWHFTRPAGKVLGPSINNKHLLRIFVKDLIVPDNTIANPKLFSEEGGVGQANPNITKVWPEVEVRGIGEISNLLGRLGKKEKLDIVEMSRGLNQWDSNLIVLGAQSIKSREFYQVMKKVGYRVGETHIRHFDTGTPVQREDGYGYGVIIKAENPHLSGGKTGVGILLGGFGVLGTQAAVYYFCKNIDKLGKEFGNKCFSIIVRARVASGKQAAERLRELDKVFEINEQNR